jgi:UDP-N-acetyl-D-galactosamine dehydrogenase
MGKFVAEKTVKLMIGAGSPIKDSTVNLLGLTFKENCPDLRNSKVPDIVYELESYGIKVHVYDPIANTSEAEKEYGLTLLDWDQLEIADAIIVAVPHSEIVTCTTENLLKKVKAGGCVIDVKSCLDKAAIVQAGHAIWCL